MTIYDAIKLYVDFVKGSFLFNYIENERNIKVIVSKPFDITTDLFVNEDIRSHHIYRRGIGLSSYEKAICLCNKSAEVEVAIRHRQFDY